MTHTMQLLTGQEDSPRCLGLSVCLGFLSDLYPQAGFEDAELIFASHLNDASQALAVLYAEYMV